MPRILTINGENVLFSPKWNIKDEVNTRSKLKFTIVDKQNLGTIEPGQAVLFERDSEKLFGGFINSVTDFEDGPGALYYSCTADDNSVIADWRVIADVILGQTAQFIVNDRLLPILAEEGVTVGFIGGADITIEKVNYPYVQISKALDDLCEITGYVWYIDAEKKLYFHRRDQFVSTNVIDDNAVVKGFKRTRKYSKYRNLEYVRAGKGETNLLEDIEPSPKPDGVSRVFVFPFPLADVPDILRINGSPILSTDIGILNVDENKKYYYQYDSNLITQAETETVLGDTDTIDMDYIGLVPIVTQVDDADQIDARASIEGGTGLHEHLAVNLSINNNDQALQYGQGQIEIYAEIQDKISFDFFEQGIKAGNFLNIQRSLYGISASFLIKSISISAFSNTVEKYSVTCLDGTSVGGWDVFFKQLVNQGKTFIIGGNELVIVLSTQRETQEFGGVVEVDVVRDGLKPSTSLTPSKTLTPSAGGVVSGEVLYD